MSQTTLAPVTSVIMARLGRLGFLGLAVVFHVVYILSIFDIYFTSPIVSGMTAYSVGAPKAPAKRLVLYVGTIKQKLQDRRCHGRRLT